MCIYFIAVVFAWSACCTNQGVRVRFVTNRERVLQTTGAEPRESTALGATALLDFSAWDSLGPQTRHVSTSQYFAAGCSLIAGSDSSR